MLGGPWRVWRFGPDLRLEPAEDAPEAPAKADKKAVAEEGLETLLLLNLDRVLPEYGLRILAKSLRAWSGADLSAVDPLGYCHVFEVKYGAKTEHVIDQGLSYALDLLRSRHLRWFDEMDPREQDVLVATRIAGLWAGRRMDKSKRTAETGRDEQQEATPLDQAEHYLRQFVPKAGKKQPLSFDALMSAAGRYRVSVLSMPNSAGQLRPSQVMGMHLHLVIPTGAKLQQHQLDALRHLRYRGTRASIWEVSVRLEEHAGSGVFWMRERFVAPLDPSGKRSKNASKPFVPAPDVGALLAQAAARAPHAFLGEGAPSFRFKGDNTAFFGADGWEGFQPILVLTVGPARGANRCVLRVSVGTTTPKYLLKSGAGREVARRRIQTVADFCKSWQASSGKLGVETTIAHTKKTATVTVPVDLDDLAPAARVLAAAVETSLKVAEANSGALGGYPGEGLRPSEWASCFKP